MFVFVFFSFFFRYPVLPALETETRRTCGAGLQITHLSLYPHSQDIIIVGIHHTMVAQLEIPTEPRAVSRCWKQRL